MKDKRCSKVIFYSNIYCLDALNPIDVTGAFYRWPKMVAVIAAVHPHLSR